MPFDPISVVGILGTTAGLVGFMVSTVENITIRLRHYNECVKRLQQYNHTVESTFLELQLWSSTWSHYQSGRYVPYDDRAYELFWGPSGFRGIAERSEVIRQDVVAIADLLRCHNIKYNSIDWEELGRSMSGPSESEILAWHKMLDSPQASRRQGTRAGTNWTYRFLFAIHKSTELESRIGNLQDRVSQLLKTSIVLYRRQHENRTNEPTYNQLRQTATLQDERRGLLQFLDELFQDNCVSDTPWALELGTPLLHPALSRLRGTSRVQVEFIFKNQQMGDTQHTGIKVAYPKACSMYRPRLFNARGVRSSALSLSWMQSQRSPPKMFQLRSPDTLDIYGMSTYALAGVAAARSTILLYESTWLDGLCFCGMDVYDAANPNDSLAYLPRDECPHIDNSLRKEVFLLLAILLAELAMGAPIRVHRRMSSPEAVPVFEVPETHLLPGFASEMDWESLSELLSERMYEIPEHFVSVEYLEAMDYCYELSQRLTQRKFVDDDVDICIKRIEAPLEKLHDALAERSRELAKMRWYQDIALRSRRIHLAELPGCEAAAELE